MSFSEEERAELIAALSRTAEMVGLLLDALWWCRYQKNAVTMPIAMSATAPSIRSRSSISPPGGGEDWVWRLIAFDDRSSPTFDHPSSPTHNCIPRSASIECVADRAGGELRARDEPDGSAGTLESLRRETTIDQIHRATAY